MIQGTFRILIGIEQSSLFCVNVVKVEISGSVHSIFVVVVVEKMP